MVVVRVLIAIFFCIASETTEFSTLSLHDALPILALDGYENADQHNHKRDRRSRIEHIETVAAAGAAVPLDQKSTRLNSSHRCTSYAVFCLKKKIKAFYITTTSRQHLQNKSPFAYR